MKTHLQGKQEKQNPKEKLLQTVLAAVKESIIKEDGVTFADIEDIFGTNTKFRAALCAEMKIFF